MGGRAATASARRVRREIAAALILATIATGTACTSGPVKIGPRPPATPTLLGVTRGSGCGFLLFNIAPIGVNERVEKAHQEAQLANGMRAVTDVKVIERWWIVPFVGTVLCTDVEETAIQ